MNTVRLLAPSQVPTSLWQSESRCLILPDEVAAAYAGVLGEFALADRRKAARDSHGAEDSGQIEDADSHFVARFDGSLARAQLVMLDPEERIASVSDALIRLFAGGSICIVDAPSGAGAAVWSFLSSIARLRADSVLPRTALEVHLIAADLLPRTQELHRKLFSKLQPFLSEQGISIVTEYQTWDVLDAMSNKDLIEKIHRVAPASSRRLLVVANFSDFLGVNANWKGAQDQLEELIRHNSTRDANAVWIESQMRPVTRPGGLFDRLREATEKWKWTAQLLRWAGFPAFQQCDCKYRPPEGVGEVNVRLAVIRLELSRAIS